MNKRPRWRSAALGVAASVALVACDRDHGGSTAEMPQRPQLDVAVITDVPLGDVAGAAESSLAARLPNPYAGNAQAVQQGKDLYIKMNCAGCHAYGGTGAMGPDLTDGYWRYGGVPASIFSSIYQGRPQGMPAWGEALPPQDIWKIVAYIQSLGGSYPPDKFQAQLQGDKRGENLPAEVSETGPPGPELGAASAAQASPTPVASSSGAASAPSATGKGK